MELEKKKKKGKWKKNVYVPLSRNRCYLLSSLLDIIISEIISSKEKVGINVFTWRVSDVYVRR